MNTRISTFEDAVKANLMLQSELETCRGELALSHSRHQKMERLFAQVADAVFLTELDGRIIDVNPAACAMLGYEKQEVLQMHLGDFATDARDEIPKFLAAMTPGVPVRSQRTCRHKNGELKILELHLARADYGGSDLIVISIRDVTGARHAEALLAEEKRLLEMIAQGHSLSAILTALCQLFESQCGSSLTSILLLDPGTRQLWHGAAPNLPPEFTEAINGHVIGPSAGSCGTAAYRGEPVIVSDISVDPLWNDYRNAALAFGLRACWSTPIFSTEREVLGTFAVYSRELGSPTQQQQETIVQLAHVASISIERTRVHDALRRSEAYLAEAQKLSLTGSFGWNASSGELVWSEETFRILGYDPATQPSLEVIFKRIHADDITLVKQMLAQAKNEGTELDFVHRLLMPDETIKHIHVVGHVRNDEPGGKEYVGAVMDITEHFRTKVALEEAFSIIKKSERDFRLIVDNIPGLIATTTGTGVVDFVNRQIAEYFGQTSNELRGWANSDTVHPDDLPRVREQWIRSIETGSPREIEQRLRRADGAYRWFQLRSSPVRDSEGHIIRWYSLLTDIDDLKRAEEALRSREQRFRLIFDSIPGLVSTRAATGAPEFVNKQMLEYFGPSLDQLPDWSSLIHPDDRKRVASVWRNSVETGHQYDVEHRARRADGVYRWVHARGEALRDPEGRIVRWWNLITDIDDRKRAEDALFKARADLAHVTRITTMGELAASIAHEVNQPLAAVVTNANACLRWLNRTAPDLNEAREAVQRIIRDGNRGSEVIGRVRALLKKEDPLRKRVNINEIVQEIVRLMQAELGGIVLQMELARELPWVSADGVQLQQVLLNLLMNAHDAMKTVSDRPHVLRIETKTYENSAVLVAVQDSGVGLQPERIEQLFETFYTTKAEGLGMGLSVSRSIIESHGGRLWAECNAGPGALFQFTLPAEKGGAT